MKTILVALTVTLAAVIAAAALAAGAARADTHPLRITTARFAETYYDASARAPGYTLVSVTLRTCVAEIPTRLFVEATETLSSGAAVRARAVHRAEMPRSYARAAGQSGCVWYRLGWRQAPVFSGGESYYVSVRVKDESGFASVPARRQFIHGTAD